MGGLVLKAYIVNTTWSPSFWRLGPVFLELCRHVHASVWPDLLISACQYPACHVSQNRELECLVKKESHPCQ